jgi:hypothetical protein
MTMRHIRTLVAIAASLLAATGIAQPEDSQSFSIEATAANQYIWRGVVVTDGPVLQTSTTIGYRGAHFNLFTNQDLNRVNERRGKVNELDFDLGYDYTVRAAHVTVSGGAIRYEFPYATDGSTTEMYTGVTAALPLHPSARVFFDVGANHGRYVTVDASHTVSLPRLGSRLNWGAMVSAGAGCGSASHNAFYYGVARFAMADLHPSAALSFGYGKFRLTPRLNYGMLLGPALRRGPAAKVHNLYGGVSLSYTL